MTDLKLDVSTEEAYIELLKLSARDEILAYFYIQFEHSGLPKILNDDYLNKCEELRVVPGRELILNFDSEKREFSHDIVDHFVRTSNEYFADNEYVRDLYRLLLLDGKNEIITIRAKDNIKNAVNIMLNKKILAELKEKQFELGAGGVTTRIFDVRQYIPIAPISPSSVTLLFNPDNLALRKRGIFLRFNEEDSPVNQSLENKFREYVEQVKETYE